MNASSWRKAADLVAQGTPTNLQVQAAATAESKQLESLPLSALSADDSGPPQVTYDSQQPIATSTPRATSTLTLETPTETYCQIIPGMRNRLYPTLVVDGSLSTHVADNCSMLQNQITSEVDKYLQEVVERHERDVNYFNGWHMATNTSSQQQGADFVEHDEEKVLESNGQDTSDNGAPNADHDIQYHDELETIPEEEEDEDPQMAAKQEADDLDTIVYNPEVSEEESFYMAIDDTSEDPTIVMGKPVTTAFISDDVHVSTEKVGGLQVTSQLQEFLNHFPPESKEKAFEQIYQILQVLDAYLIDNSQQHLYCMSPDSKYISLIMYTTELEIDLCNFPAIWAVLSTLLDTQSNELQYVKNLQQVVDNYYDKCPTEVMSRLEHQITDIMNAMYDNITNDNFDSISDYTDRVSGAVDNDYDRNDNDEMPYDNDNDEMPYDNDNDQMPYEYDNDNDTAITELKNDRNMTNDKLKDVGTKDVVPYKRDDNMMTKVKRPIEASDVDNDFMREYDIMRKSMEDRQINDFYEAQRHIQSAMKGDTPVKTGHYRQCIDNITDYDREHNRIFKSVHHRLDLGPNMLPGAQQHTTVESAAALKIQDKIEGKYDENMQNINGQYRNEMYKRAENMIPQLDGTFNISDDSDSDSHSYLDLAGTNIIAYRTRGQKQRHDENERANTNRRAALKEYIKPNAKVKIQRQKVSDDEDIDIDKIVPGDKPKEDRNSATKTEKQYKEKEAKRLVLEKAKRIQMQKDMKDKEAKRFPIEKTQIEALIEKHRPHTPKTPDEVSKLGTGKNAKVDGQEGTKKVKPPYKKATKDIQIKKSCKKGKEAKNTERGNTDTLLGNPVANTATGTEKATEKGLKDKIGIDYIGIFEFIFYGLPELPELEGIDEDRLRELQNAVQEQLCQRDEERERNITKRVQEFEKTFDFVNSLLLKGVATMAELTKTDNRQPMGKIKSTDKMVMMPSLFDGTKPAMSKQHY